MKRTKSYKKQNNIAILLVLAMFFYIFTSLTFAVTAPKASPTSDSSFADTSTEITPDSGSSLANTSAETSLHSGSSLTNTSAEITPHSGSSFAESVSIKTPLGVSQPAGALLSAENDNNNIEYLAFSSDVHNSGSDDPTKKSVAVMQKWLDNIVTQIGKPLTQMGFCGDYSVVNYPGITESKYWELSKEAIDIINDIDSVQGKGFFVAGNHENEQGKLSTTTNPVSLNIHRPGDVEVGDFYILYSFGAESSNMNTGFTDSAVHDLESFLLTAPTDKPIFILSHFPLHSFSSGTTVRTSPNAKDVINILNEANKSHTIIFLWGHNHSNSDPMYDKIITPFSGNNTIVINTKTKEKAVVNFTYAAAGSMCDHNTFTYGGTVKARGMVAAVNKDTDEITLCYFDSDSNPFCETSVYRTGQIAIQYDNDNLRVAYFPSDSGNVTYLAAFYDNKGKTLKAYSLSQDPAVSQSACFDVKTKYASWKAMVISADSGVPLADLKTPVFNKSSTSSSEKVLL